MDNKFNIRVYGIWIHEDRVLINEEHFRGMTVYKFPGGGLEWGEGIRDCLIREWREELNIDIEVLDHFYTTDFFQKSAFDGSQVISIYYFVSAIPQQTFINNFPNERTYWKDLKDISADTFTLTIDKRVGDMLANL